MAVGARRAAEAARLEIRHGRSLGTCLDADDVADAVVNRGGEIAGGGLERSVTDLLLADDAGVLRRASGRSHRVVRRIGDRRILIVRVGAARILGIRTGGGEGGDEGRQGEGGRKTHRGSPWLVVFEATR